MKKVKLEILQRYRLRPEKKGRIPKIQAGNITKAEISSSVIEQRIAISLELNKFGNNGMNLKLSHKVPKIKTQTEKLDFSTIQNESCISQNPAFRQSQCQRVKQMQLNRIPCLKYNDTKIEPLSKPDRITVSTKRANTGRPTQENRLKICRSNTSAECQLPKIPLTQRAAENTLGVKKRSDFVQHSDRDKQNDNLKKCPKIALSSIKSKKVFSENPYGMRQIVSISRREMSKIF